MSDFPTKSALQPAPGAEGCSSPPCADGFVAKLNPAGKALVFSTYLGGSGDDVGYGMDIDADGNVYVTGWTNSDNFPVKDAWAPARTDFLDIFVVRIDPTKSGAASLIYGTYLGGFGSDYGYGIAVDGGGNAYVTGYTGPASLYEFPTTATIGSNGTSSGIFVTKFSPNPTQRMHLPLVRR